jgi:hypothetical protein
MVATSGWERLGFARLADYAGERAGISGRELRDLAAVDRALTELPALDAAFCAGEIGWTQLRLLCRVATPEDQQEWLTLAGRLTARELAREVRAVDRRAREPLDAESDEEERVGVVLRLTPRARARWWSARQVANRVAGHALSHGAFAEVLAAEVLSGVSLSEEANPSLRGAEEAEAGSRLPRLSDSSCPEWRVSPALRELDAEVAALEHDLESADAFELDRRLRLAVQMESRGLARVAALLTDVVVWGLHRDLGASAASTVMPRTVSAWRRAAHGHCCASSAPRGYARRCARRLPRVISPGCRPTSSCRCSSTPRRRATAKAGSPTRSA